MALAYDGAIQRLIDAFANLPGIGRKARNASPSTCSTRPMRNRRH